MLPVGAVPPVVFMMEQGGSDNFYLRFTTPRQRSMVVGTSRAAQGLVPSVLNQKLSKTSGDIYNYAFTVHHSPFGKSYLKGIQRKLSGDTTGYFIIAVDPWSICVEGGHPNNEELFPEKDGFLDQIEDPTANPNVKYLLDFYPIPYYNILLRRVRSSHMKLHHDGWLEVTVSMDSAKVEQRVAEKCKLYRQHANVYKYSARRRFYLEEITRLLKKHGEVYLVRLPVHPEMKKIEQEFMPEFDLRIDTLARANSVPYIDLSEKGANYQYTDGNHLFKNSSETVSAELAELILNFRRQPSTAHILNQPSL
jgi:hypothetical protein